MSKPTSSEHSHGDNGQAKGKVRASVGDAASGASGVPLNIRGRQSVEGSPLGRFLIAARTVRPEASDRRALWAAVEQLSGQGLTILSRSDDDQVEPETARRRMCPPVLLVETDAHRLDELVASRQWLIEPDQALSPPSYRWSSDASVGDPGLLGATRSATVTIVVRDSDGRPVPGAAVYAYGVWPGYAVAGDDGSAVLTLPAGCIESVSALLVVPASGMWSRLVVGPQLAADVRYEVTVEPLSTALHGIPNVLEPGWGATALRLEQLPPNYRGRGVKIAIIDSGIAADHVDLAGRISAGVNLSTDPAGWDVDQLGFGTACAGIIAATDNDHGITGIAVDAEFYAIKALPGTLSSLLRALDYCMDQQIDIVQINVTGQAGSHLLATKLADVHNAGILVIAPAGDTRGPVAAPASLPEVIAVGAAYQPGTFPPGTVHDAHITADPLGPESEVLPASFTAAGPGVDLVAPGVAVITTAHTGGYVPRDGTAIAAAYVTGLAALVLGHHDDFTSQLYTHRGPQRADHLRRLLLGACRPVYDPRRTGAGMPDACRALGFATPPEIDWETAVLYQLHVDMARAGLLPQRQ